MVAVASESRSFIDVETLSDNWNLRAVYNRVRTDEDSLLFYTYLGDAELGLDPQTGLGLVGYGGAYDSDDKQDTFDVYANGTFEAWGQLHEVVVGANYSRLDYVDVSLYDFHTGNGFPAMPSLADWDGNTPFLSLLMDGMEALSITRKKPFTRKQLALTNDFKVLLGGRYYFQTDGVGYGVDQYVMTRSLFRMSG